MIPYQGIYLQALSGVVSINSKRYREQIAIYARSGRCVVVNHLDLESYLASVVNSEFNANWAASAVDAQIIAARTYALFQIKAARKNFKSLYDLESNEKDQMYLGLDRVNAVSIQAVRRTTGKFLVGINDGKVLKAFYHSTCGGNTLVPEKIWGQSVAGYRQSVPCPYCVHSPLYQWDLKLSERELSRRILQAVKSDKDIRSAFPTRYLTNPAKWRITNWFMPNASATSDRGAISTSLKFESDQDSFLAKVSVYRLRNWLNPKQIRSVVFQAKPIVNRFGDAWFEIQGRGAGHGVGLCQFGAKRMGEKGYPAEQILKAYYPLAKVQSIQL
jgi:stage II sporulation protein D